MLIKNRKENEDGSYSFEAEGSVDFSALGESIRESCGGSLTARGPSRIPAEFDPETGEETAAGYIDPRVVYTVATDSVSKTMPSGADVDSVVEAHTGEPLPPGPERVMVEVDSDGSIHIPMPDGKRRELTAKVAVERAR